LRLLISTDQRFQVSPDGAFYASGPAHYRFWSHYLETFDEVLVLARARPMNAKERSGDQRTRADGGMVRIHTLPDFSGLWQYSRSSSVLKYLIRGVVADCDAYILHVPGIVSRIVCREIRHASRSYALEVLGDPWDALGPGTWPNLLRPVLRVVATRELRLACREAIAVRYVTQNSLQRRYPPGPNRHAFAVSNVMAEDIFASSAQLNERLSRIDAMGRRSETAATAFRIGFIGSLARLYKGPDVLLHAAALLRQRGVDLELRIVGDGRHLRELQALSHSLGLAERTEFIGALPPGKPIYDFLDMIDLFVMPSRAEGLPRALLEAMARACPCIGSNVGGIPELLAPEDLVPVGDCGDLAEMIASVSRSPQRLKKMSLRNFDAANQFRPEVLDPLRRQFLTAVRAHFEKVAVHNRASAYAVGTGQQGSTARM